MRIAFLLFGIVGYTHKYGAFESVDGGIPIDVGMCAENYKKMVFNSHKVDVFIHTWSTKFEKSLKRMYPVMGGIFQPQIKFDVHKYPADSRKDRFVELSRWYSTKKVIELQHKYSIDNNIQYDFIMLSRFDMLWSTPVAFEELEKDKLYIPNWNDWGYRIDDIPRKSNHSNPFGKKMSLYQDMWIIGNQEHMQHISTLYDRVDKHTGPKHSPHQFLFIHLDKYRRTDSIRFKYHYGIDYNLYRRAVLKNWM